MGAFNQIHHGTKIMTDKHYIAAIVETLARPDYDNKAISKFVLNEPPNFKLSLETVIQSINKHDRLYKLYLMDNKTIVVIKGRNAIDYIESISLEERNGNVIVEAVKCKAEDNYNINRIDNFWLHILLGRAKRKHDVFCVKHGDYALWIKVDKRGKYTLATAYSEGYKHAMKIIGSENRYELDTFRNSNIASFSEISNNAIVKEEDVIITASTIKKIGKSKAYRRYQDGASVQFI